MLLAARSFFIKEHVAVMKLTDTYDIIDPESQQRIGIAKDDPSTFGKYARLLLGKRILPTTIRVYESESNPPVLTLEKKAGIIRIRVIVKDAQQTEIGTLVSKILTMGGGFFVKNHVGNQIAEIKGDWRGWNFRLLDNNGAELGVVTKKWAGIGKELFTTADNYLISLSAMATAKPETTALLLAAGLAIDIVFKEKKS